MDSPSGLSGSNHRQTPHPMLSPSLYESELLEAGIPTEAMDLVVALQRHTNWCWAACIVMVYRLHGIHVTQEEIVARTFGRNRLGRLPNWPAGSVSISRNLR